MIFLEVNISLSLYFFLFVCRKMMTVIYLLHFYSIFFNLQLLYFSLLQQKFDFLQQKAKIYA
ncbi:unnamed protein product, partial [Brassica napus]